MRAFVLLLSWVVSLVLLPGTGWAIVEGQTDDFQDVMPLSRGGEPEVADRGTEIVAGPQHDDARDGSFFCGVPKGIFQSDTQGAFVR